MTDTQELSFEGISYPLAPLEPLKANHPTDGLTYTITPDIARYWLRYNFDTTNRNARESGKKNYARDMEHGDWMLNGSMISFTRPYGEGEDANVPAGSITVLDGQHRLKACVASGKPFVSYVAFGFHPRVRPTVDTGIKRTFSDTLKLRGEKDTNNLASITTRCYAWMHDDKHMQLRSKGGLTHEALLDFLGEHPEIRRSVEIAANARHDFKETAQVDLRPSTAGTAHWLILLHDPQGVAEFFARVGDGDRLAVSDPISELRRRFVRDVTVKKQVDGMSRKELLSVPDWHHLCYYIRTYNARRVWELLPENLQDDFSFALVGPKDALEMPSLMTAEQVIADAETRIRRAEKKSGA